MSKRSIIILCIVVTVIILGIFIFFIGRAYERKEIKLDASEEIVKENDLKNSTNSNFVETSSKEKTTVSPSAKIEMTQYYEECGHVVKDEYKVPSSIVNMSEEKVKEYYNGWDVQFFSSDSIKLYKIKEGICNEHYVIRDVDGYVNVFVLNKSGEEILFRATDIMCKYLSENDKESLKNGISVVGKSNMETTLEDFE